MQKEDYLMFIETFSGHEAFRIVKFQITSEVFCKFLFDLCLSQCQCLDMELFAFFLLTIFLQISKEIEEISPTAENEKVFTSILRNNEEIKLLENNFYKELEKMKEIYQIQYKKRNLRFYRAWCEWNYLRINEMGENILIRLSHVLKEIPDFDRIYDLISIFEKVIDSVNNEVSNQMKTKEKFETPKKETEQPQNSPERLDTHQPKQLNFTNFKDAPLWQVQLAKIRGQLVQTMEPQTIDKQQFEIASDEIGNLIIKKVIKMPILGKRILPSLTGNTGDEKKQVIVNPVTKYYVNSSIVNFNQSVTDVQPVENKFLNEKIALRNKRNGLSSSRDASIKIQTALNASHIEPFRNKSVSSHLQHPKEEKQNMISFESISQTKKYIDTAMNPNENLRLIKLDNRKYNERNDIEIKALKQQHQQVEDHNNLDKMQFVVTDDSVLIPEFMQESKKNMLNENINSQKQSFNELSAEVKRSQIGKKDQKNLIKSQKFDAFEFREKVGHQFESGLGKVKNLSYFLGSEYKVAPLPHYLKRKRDDTNKKQDIMAQDSSQRIYQRDYQYDILQEVELLKIKERSMQQQQTPSTSFGYITQPNESKEYKSAIERYKPVWKNYLSEDFQQDLYKLNDWSHLYNIITLLKKKFAQDNRENYLKNLNIDLARKISDEQSTLASDSMGSRLQLDKQQFKLTIEKLLRRDKRRKRRRRIRRLKQQNPLNVFEKIDVKHSKFRQAKFLSSSNKQLYKDVFLLPKISSTVI